MERDNIFISNNFTINNNEIIILKNGIPTDKLELKNIKSIEVSKVRTSFYWILSALFGGAISLLFLYLIIKTTINYSLPNDHHIKGSLMVYFSYYSLFVFGVFIIISSIKKTYVFKVILINNPKYTIYLTDINSKKKINNLVSFLKETYGICFSESVYRGN